MRKILPVILCGGSGKRLWPLSRRNRPKPLIKLTDGETFFQKTYLRARKIADNNEVIIVTNQELFFPLKNEIDKLKLPASKSIFITEPIGRNTTAAICTSAHYISKNITDDSIMFVMPSDHLITKTDKLIDAVMTAKEFVLNGNLVTFGVKPSYPATGYGYIHAKQNSVKKFVEKPEEEIAKKFLAEGDYFWNSGMFCMDSKILFEELSLYSSDIVKQTEKAVSNAEYSHGTTWKHIEIEMDDYKDIEDISVDYAVFERSKKISFVSCDVGWSDVGSWNELGKLYQLDENLNHINCSNVINKKTKNCIIKGSDRLIATIGLDNLIISDTPDALLVAHKDHAQDVSDIVEKLISNKDQTTKEFPLVERPWGSYMVLKQDVGYKLKTIKVNPKSSLSLQSHKHRSEHWTVVKGEATVINNETSVTLNEGQSIFIAANDKHRLENHHDTNELEIIEIQLGNYLGEDDIIRHEDDYGR